MAKICLVSLNCYCLFNPESAAPMGGAELEAYVLARAFATSHAVTVVTGDWGQPPEERYGKVRVIRSMRLGGRDRLRQLAIFWRALRAANADIYWSTGAGMEVGLIAAYCLLRGRRYIYRTAHETDCDGSFIHSHGLAGRLYRFGLNRASLVATSVKSHQELLRKFHPRLLSRVRHVKLALELSEGRRTAKKDTVLWVSRCENWKRPELFLELARRLPVHRFVMIAPRQAHRPELFERMKKEAESLSNVEFHGLIPFREIQPYFDRAKAFVNTSDTEGFTYTLIQSGQAGTPVAYLSVNPDGVITDHGCGVWADGDMDRLAEGLERLLSSEKEWHRASDGIRRYIMKNHEAGVVAGKWEQLFAEL